MDISLSDESIIDAIVAGERKALAMLYDRHSPKLMRIMFNIIRSQQDAEDLLHDFFLEVWKKADTYCVERGTVLSWLIIRARSRAIDRKRALDLLHGRRATNDIEEQNTNAFTLEQSLNEMAISKALAQLSHKQRITVLLSYFHGWTYEDIARRDGIPIGTVKSRLSSAIHKLSQYFATAKEAAL